MRHRMGDYGELLRDRMALAAVLSAGDYIQAQRRRRELIAAMANAVGNFPVPIVIVPGELSDAEIDALS